MLEFCGNKGIKQEYSNARTLQQNGVAERMNRTLINPPPRIGETMEEKPNVKGVGYRWMFDIDYLINSMNYIPVSLKNQTNPHAGISEVTNSACTLQTPNANASKEEDEAEELIIVPTAVRQVGPRKSSTNSKAEEFFTELQNLKTQEKEAYSTGISEDTPEILAFRRELDELAQKHLREVPKNKATSTNSVNSVSRQDHTQPTDHDDSDMPELTIFNKPQKGIFDEASYDDEGMVYDFNNLPTEVPVSPIPTLRIHNIHPQSQILGDPKSSVQTRSRVQQHSGAHALEEPKKISKALKDDSWVEAMQEELLQFRLQQIWIQYNTQWIKVIGTKWVYKVVKALYGLHQAPRAWYATLSTFIGKHGHRRGTIDKTLFIKKDKKDIMLVQMSSMGELTFFLGLQVKQNKAGIFISQDKYVAEILKKFDLVNVKTAITPMETKVALTKDEEDVDVDVTPKTSHLNAVKRIFKYLKGKLNSGLWYPRESPFDLEAFSDSDYGGSNLDKKSTTGGCQFLGQRLISWQCKKQTIVTTSTTEAEYVAAAN
ncbi:putative ribonuclease H-like domain-containing protein [Tanacetum coccineum]